MHKFVPMPQAMKILDEKAAVGKIDENPGMASDESQK